MTVRSMLETRTMRLERLAQYADRRGLRAYAKGDFAACDKATRLAICLRRMITGGLSPWGIAMQRRSESYL